MRNEKSIKVPVDVYDILCTIKATTGQHYGETLRAALANIPQVEQTEAPVKLNRKREAASAEKIVAPDPGSMVNNLYTREILYAPDAYIVGLSQTSKVVGTNSTIKIVSGDKNFYLTMPGECWAEFTTNHMKHAGASNALELLRILCKPRTKDVEVTYNTFCSGIVAMCAPERKRKV